MSEFKELLQGFEKEIDRIREEIPEVVRYEFDFDDDEDTTDVLAVLSEGECKFTMKKPKTVDELIAGVKHEIQVHLDPSVLEEANKVFGSFEEE